MLLEWMALRHDYIPPRYIILQCFIVLLSTLPVLPAFYYPITIFIIPNVKTILPFLKPHQLKS